MNTRCSSCGKDVAPKAGPGGVLLCPECRAVLTGPSAAERKDPAPPLKARGAEFRNKHSVEAGAAFSKSTQVFVANILPFLAVTLVVLSPEILYGIYYAFLPPDEVTKKAAGTYTNVQQVLGGLLRTLVSAAIIFGVFQYLRGASVSMASIFSGGMARVIPALWTGFLAFIATALPMLPGLWLMMSYATKDNSVNVGPLAAGGGLMVIGGIFSMIISTMVYVAVPVSVVEKVNGIPAIRRSLALTKGNRGQIFVILLALGILTAIANFVIRWTGGHTSVTLLGLLVTVVMSAFGGVFAGVVYYNLRAVKEGIGIEELAKAFD